MLAPRAAKAAAGSTAAGAAAAVGVAEDGAAARWFDSHCHLQERYLPDAGPADPGPAGDRHAAVAGELRRAWGAGVRRAVCVGTDAETSAQAVALATAVREGALGDAAPELWATIGLHPHEASSGTDAVTALLDESIGISRSSSSKDRPVVVGVGECGLDYYYEHSPRAAQRHAFAEQIALAIRHDLALVIHAREAWSDLWDVLAAEGVPARTVLHCFTGGPEEARRCLDLGMFVSFSGIATFKNAPEVREAAALCPADRLLVETDSPFLAPVPHRGSPNEPAFVPLVGAVLAQVRGVEPEQLAVTSWDAASAAFRCRA